MDAETFKSAMINFGIKGKLTNLQVNGHSSDLNFLKDQVKKINPNDEEFFEIPSHWKWVNLESIADIQTGFNFKSSNYKDEGIRIIRISDFDENGFKNNKIVYYEEDKKLDRYSLEENDILMAMTGGTVGKCFLVHHLDEKMYLNQRIAKIRSKSSVTPHYLNYLIQSPFIQHIININKTSTNDNISMKTISNFPIPLPPLEEQQNIVEFLDVVNNYTKKEIELREINKKFYKDFRNCVLHLATRGKLVEQKDIEGSGSELLKKIQDEKDFLRRNKEIKRNNNECFIFFDKNHYYEKSKKQKDLICIDKEIPFEIPSNWVWCRLENILTKLTDGAHKRPKYVDEGIPFISVKDISDGNLNLSNTKYISIEDYEKLYQRCNYIRGDILLSKVGTTGIPVIIDTDIKFGLFVSVALLKFNHNLVYNKFLKFLLESPLVQKQCLENTRGVANKNWVLKDIAHTLIPLPPLEEQKRIVIKIEELFNESDSFKLL